MGSNSLGMLVDLDENLVPHAGVFKNGQSIGVHLLDGTGLVIRREGGSVKMLLGVSTSIADSCSSGTSGVGSCLYSSGCEIGGGVLQVSFPPIHY